MKWALLEANLKASVGMDLKNLRVEHLRNFLAVADHSNFTRAAQECGLSQPTISRQMKFLEDEVFGVALFRPSGKGIALTEAGRALVEEATQILGAAARAEDRLQGWRSGSRGRLRIGASTTPAYALLPGLIAAYTAARPQVSIKLRVTNSRAIERLIDEDRVDLGFVGTSLQRADMVETAVFEDRIACLVAADHPLARRPELALADLAGETLLLREQGSATRDLIEARLSEHGLSLKQSIEVPDAAACLAMAAAGVGLAFASLAAARGLLGDGRFARLPVPQLEVERPLWMVWHAAKSQSPAMTAFIEGASDPARSGAGPTR